MRASTRSQLASMAATFAVKLASSLNKEGDQLIYN